MTKRTENRLLSEKEVAHLLGVTPSWLQKGRCLGAYGPDYLKINGAIRYRRDDVEAYLNSNRVQLHNNSTGEGA